IEDDMLNGKHTDEEFDNILKEFKLTNEISDSGTNKWKICRYHDNGCTEEQMEMIKGILLSTEYNYKKFEEKLSSQKDRIERDVENDTYKGRTLEDYESLRLEAIEKIKNTEGFAEKLQVLKGYGLVINEGLEKLAEYGFVKETVASDKICELAENMIKYGFSLTKITKYLQTDLLSVYYLAKQINRPFNLSPEEEKLVREAEDKINEEKAAVGEDSSSNIFENSLRQYKIPKTWSEMVLKLQGLLTSVCKNVEIYSSKPITSEMFLKDSDVVIDIKYSITDFYSANEAFFLLMNCLFPSGCCAVTNQEHMLIYSKKTKKPDEIIYDNDHCIFKDGIWKFNLCK
ncbi:MAG: hypothetical protein LUD81_10700, partial [Clostridiales bacterium]|nr:hypothetical protein [Clostridiales bacterium]